MRGCFVCGGRESWSPCVPVQSVQMQRIAFSTLVTTLLAFGPAVAGPLNLNPQTQPTATSAPSRIGSIFAAPQADEPAPRMSYAATEPTYGGGFLEFLFRPGAAPQRQYQPEPQPDPVYGRAHGGDQDVDDPRSRQ